MFPGSAGLPERSGPRFQKVSLPEMTHLETHVMTSGVHRCSHASHRVASGEHDSIRTGEKRQCNKFVRRSFSSPGMFHGLRGGSRKGLLDSRSSSTTLKPPCPPELL